VCYREGKGFAGKNPNPQLGWETIGKVSDSELEEAIPEVKKGESAEIRQRKRSANA